MKPPGKSAAGECKNESIEYNDASTFGRTKTARVNYVDDEQEEPNDNPDIAEGLNFLLPGSAGFRQSYLGTAPAQETDYCDKHSGLENTRPENRQKKFTDRLLRNAGGIKMPIVPTAAMVPVTRLRS